MRQSNGHRGGVAREALVYRRLLVPSGLSVPRFLGAHTEPTTGDVWLFIEHVAGGERVNKSRDPRAMTAAAGWAAALHRSFDGPAAGAATPLLHRYDADYYLGWARRTSEYIAPLRRQLGWVGRLLERFTDIARELDGGRPTLIHGEYCPHNVMVAGEPEEVVKDCERAYCDARWHRTPPADAGRRLTAARVSWTLRRLGDRPERTLDGRNRWRLDHLRDLGQQLGIV